jgi:pimeloyl-ACP methyl ester carboxylesterase
VSYARSGEFDIAYITLGAGPFDIVIAPGMVTHLEAVWEAGVGRNELLATSQVARVITFDKRGQGMSDRMVGAPTLEERIDDIRAVMDAAGSRQAVLWGASEGGPMCILFAATYPDRVLALVLAGTFARLDNDEGAKVSERFTAFPAGWGKGVTKDLVFPDFPELSRATCAHIERLSSTPSNVRRQVELMQAIDVRGVLPAIRVPTLVLHREEDPLVPAVLGRELAAGIPGARLVVAPGCSHAKFDDEGVMLAAVGEFLASLAPPETTDEQLATVLVCPGVATADLTANAERFRGKALKAAGGQTHFVFDGPTRAVECALANRAATPGLAQGLALGIVTLSSQRVAGPAAAQAAATAAAATSGEVLLTRTLHDVLAGARFRLQPAAADLFRVEV